MNSTACCPNTAYCIINSTTWEAKCCPLGSTCGGYCDTEHYLANITTTTTVSSSVTVETALGCTGRTCFSTNYLCPSSMGGGCCPYGSDCGYDSTASKGLCLSVATSSSTTASATATTTPTGGVVVVQHQSHGLSTGAKAGIAVGVVAVAALVVGALTWMCLRRRRSTRTTTTTAQEMDTNPDRRAAPAAIPPPSNDGGVRPYRADSYGPHMSEVDGYSYSAGYAPSSSHGGDGRLASGADYFGPAGAAYYTQQHQRAVSPEHSSVGGGGGQAVEIGSRGDNDRAAVAGAHSILSSRPDSDGASQSELADTSSAQLARGGSLSRRHEAPASGGAGVRDSIAGRFELYGGDVMASPSSPGASVGDVYYDAPESRLAGASANAGGSGLLPQPLPTPGSEMSEFATPSPMSRDESEQLPRREV